MPISLNREDDLVHNYGAFIHRGLVPRQPESVWNSLGLPQLAGLKFIVYLLSSKSVLFRFPLAPFTCASWATTLCTACLPASQSNGEPFSRRRVSHALLYSGNHFCPSLQFLPYSIRFIFLNSMTRSKNTKSRKNRSAKKKSVFLVILSNNRHDLSTS